MKRLSILLGITFGLVAPLAVHAGQAVLIADTTAPQGKAKSKTDRVVVTTTAAPAKKQSARVRYEITTMTVAGSHLPVVVYHYKDEAYTAGNSFQPRRAYHRQGGGLDTTGAANVGAALGSIDPAFH